ncbi:MAG: hypothetical protein O8C61_12340 [Candidatus Methanoperedens sp.]|nr:hypothetical protein [Candidatus Methanoperedens sp.]
MKIKYLFQEVLCQRQDWVVLRYTSAKEAEYYAVCFMTVPDFNNSDPLTLILQYSEVERIFDTVMNVYSSQALDLQVNRKRFREE